MKRGQFALTGTLLIDGKNTAFLRELAGNKSRRVQAGETINGMRVTDVKADRVVLAARRRIGGARAQGGDEPAPDARSGRCDASAGSAPLRRRPRPRRRRR